MLVVNPLDVSGGAIAGELLSPEEELVSAGRLARVVWEALVEYGEFWWGESDSTVIFDYPNPGDDRYLVLRMMPKRMS